MRRHSFAPQAHKGVRRGEVRGRGQQQALQHAAEVARVEEVMESGWCGQQHRQDVVVQLHHRADQPRAQRCPRAICQATVTNVGVTRSVL